MKLLRNTGLLVAAATLALGGLLLVPSQKANAADATVNPGDSIQTAINNAASGATIVINAGTYIESLQITKPLTLTGNGTVILKTKSTTTVTKGIDILNTHDVRLENLTLDGENNDPVAQSGVDINSSSNVTVSNVTVKNYAKNGIAVVTQHDASYQTGGNVSLINVTSSGNGWSGIAFYPKSTLGYEAELTGITLGGTTTVSGNDKAGIQFGDPGDTAKTTGVSGAAVALGTVYFANNATSILNESGESSATLSASSTIDGEPVTAADFAGLNITLASTDTPTVPGVPNTATAR